MRNAVNSLRWYYFTRAAGLVVFLNEVFLDKHSPDRTSIIIAACGLMGLDKVARSGESDKPKKGD